MTMLLAADVLRGSISIALAGFCWRSSPSPQKGELKMGPHAECAWLARVCLDCAVLRTLLVMMRAKQRGRWEIAANHNVRLPGAVTGKRPRETFLDSKATQLRRANEKTRWVNLDRIQHSLSSRL
jgi:hypothetical protein